MTPIQFTANDYPTIGVEIELQLVDARTFELRSSIEEIIGRLPKSAQASVKPELMQSYLEINSGVCRTVAEVGEDLGEKVEMVQSVIDPLGLKLFWGGTHPFSSWREQKVTVDDRYYRLVELMQDVARNWLKEDIFIHG